MGFKENLKDEISYQGLMIKEVEAKAGLSTGTMSNYLKENSSIPSADIAVKIAKALNVSVEYLVQGQKSTNDTNSNPYNAQVRKIADKINLFNESEKYIVESLVNAIQKTHGLNNLR